MSPPPDRSPDPAPKRACPWDRLGLAALSLSAVFAMLTVALALVLR